MLVVVAYDVNTMTSAGRKRLRTVSKKCEAVGSRVQHSVFDCQLDAAQFRAFREDLLHAIDPKSDTIRFYHLGNRFKNRIELYGHTDRPFYEHPIVL